MSYYFYIAVRSVQDLINALLSDDIPFFQFSLTYFVAVVSIGAALFLFQQLSGINAVVYYSTSVFRSAGVASDIAASALVAAANVFG